jgi:hypothetical protein
VASGVIERREGGLWVEEWRGRSGSSGPGLLDTRGMDIVNVEKKRE